jgi:hypothetical protein
MARRLLFQRLQLSRNRSKKESTAATPKLVVKSVKENPEPPSEHFKIIMAIHGSRCNLVIA